MQNPTIKVYFNFYTLLLGFLQKNRHVHTVFSTQVIRAYSHENTTESGIFHSFAVNIRLQESDAEDGNFN
jgi:hypothetical protein